MLAIGRALMANPELILMDEPSEGLSPRLVLQVQEIMRRLRARGHAILLVEQNLELALSVADEVYVLSAGRFVFQGTPAALRSGDAGARPASRRRRQHSMIPRGTGFRKDLLQRDRAGCMKRSHHAWVNIAGDDMAHHTLKPTPTTVHWGYLDAKIPPRLTVESGDTVTVETVSGGLADVGDTSIMLPHHRAICERSSPRPGRTS